MRQARYIIWNKKEYYIIFTDYSKNTYVFCSPAFE